MKALRAFEALHELFAPGTIAIDKSIDPELEEPSKLARRSLTTKKRKTTKKAFGAKKRETRRPSMKDSLRSSLILCDKNDEDSLRAAVKKRAISQRKKKLPFTSIIVVYYDENKMPKTFYVFVDHIYFKLDSFKAALEKYLQSFEAYDLHYPNEAVRVCKFLQKICHEIDPKDDIINVFINNSKVFFKNQENNK